MGVANDHIGNIGNHPYRSCVVPGTVPQWPEPLYNPLVVPGNAVHSDTLAYILYGVSNDILGTSLRGWKLRIIWAPWIHR